MQVAYLYHASVRGSYNRVPEEVAVKMHRCLGCHTSEQQKCPGKLLVTQVCLKYLGYAPESELQVEDKRYSSWKESKKDSLCEKTCGI